MDPTQIIALINSGQPKSGWAIYRTTKGTIARILFKRLFYLLIFGGLATVFYFEFLTTGNFANVPSDDRLIGILPAIFALGYLYSTIKTIFSAFHNNFAVVADHAFITHWNGKTTAYPFEKITDLRFTNIAGRNKPLPLFGYHYFIFRDLQNNHIVEIGRDQYYQNIRELFTFLTTKIS